MKKIIYIAFLLIFISLSGFSALAKETRVTAEISVGGKLKPGDAAKAEILITADGDAVQGLQADFEIPQEILSAENFKTEIIENTSGWEYVGISKNKLLAVGGEKSGLFYIKGEISFIVPSDAAIGESYIIKLNRIIYSENSNEFQGTVKSGECVFSIKDAGKTESGNARKNNAGSTANENNVKKEDIKPREEIKKEKNLPFLDVGEKEWFYDAVKFAYNEEIVNGVSKEIFSPDGYVTRGQFITMLCRAYKIEGRSGDNFSDAGNTWYTGYLAAAKQLGISNGTGNNMFTPEEKITREEIITLIYNYLNDGGSYKDDSVNFDDADKISEWALDAVKFGVKNGYIKGKDNNCFDPVSCCTRAEAAQIFYNIMNN